MYFSFRGWSVSSAKEYLKEYRNGNFCPVYDIYTQKKLLEELPILIDKNSNVDNYAYALALYKHGDRIEQDKAFYLVEKLLDNDYLPAYDLYGLMFYDGICVSQSYATAFKWFERGADKGFAIAHYHLGCLYLEGKGVAKNVNKGMEYIERSAGYGYNKAVYYVGYCYYKGINGYPLDYLSAKNYFETGNRQSDAQSSLALYDMYDRGLGVQKNTQTAIKYLSYSALSGSTFANYKMGLINYLGESVEKNIGSAYEYFIKSAEGNNAEACYFAGSMILNKEVWWEDQNKGIQLVKKGAELGSTRAKELLKKL